MASALTAAETYARNNAEKRRGLSTVDKLRMLLDITKTISRSLDLDEVLNLVMDTLDSLIPYDAAGIYLVKCSQPLAEWEGGPDESCVFHTQAVRGYDIDDLQELHLKMGEGLIGHVAVTRQALRLARSAQRSALHQRPAPH